MQLPPATLKACALSKRPRASEFYERLPDELGVTPGARKPEVKVARRARGIHAFRRLPRSLILTDDGRSLYAVDHSARSHFQGDGEIRAGGPGASCGWASRAADDEARYVAARRLVSRSSATTR